MIPVGCARLRSRYCRSEWTPFRLTKMVAAAARSNTNQGERSEATLIHSIRHRSRKRGLGSLGSRAWTEVCDAAVMGFLGLSLEPLQRPPAPSPVHALRVERSC